ncbi:hypothetical protein PENSPDRAFT_759836 [Peniophora sp. CONT]|nr:hypothetical protein PENSPDRAFT_759836 [Peniophora sp. CONT]
MTDSISSCLVLRRQQFAVKVLTAGFLLTPEQLSFLCDLHEIPMLEHLDNGIHEALNNYLREHFDDKSLAVTKTGGRRYLFVHRVAVVFEEAEIKPTEESMIPSRRILREKFEPWFPRSVMEQRLDLFGPSLTGRASKYEKEDDKDREIMWAIRYHHDLKKSPLPERFQQEVYKACKKRWKTFAGGPNPVLAFEGSEPFVAEFCEDDRDPSSTPESAISKVPDVVSEGGAWNNICE